MSQGSVNRWLADVESAPSPGRRVVAVAVSLAVVLSIIGGVLAWRSYQDRVLRERDRVIDTADEAARASDQFLTARIAVLESLSQVPAVQQLDISEMEPVLEAVAGQELGLSGGVAWVDSDGILRAEGGTEIRRGPVDLSARPDIQLAMSAERPVISDAIQDPGEEHFFSIAVPTWANDSMTGVLVASFLLSEISREIPALAGFPGVVVRVVDQAGVVMMERGRAGSLEPPPNPSVLEVDDDGLILTSVGLMGDAGRAIGVAQADVPDWVIVVEQDADSLLAGSRTRLVVEMSVLAALTFLGVVIGIIAGQRADISHAQMLRRTRDVGVLESLSETLSASPQIQDVAENALSIFGQVFGTEAVVIGLTDRAQTHMRMHVISDGSEQELDEAIPIDSPSLLTDAFAVGETLTLDMGTYRKKYEELPGSLEVWEADGVVASRFVGRNASGAVGLFIDGGFPPTASDIGLFDAMVPLLGDAFGRAAAAESERMASRTFQHALLPRDSIAPSARLQRSVRYLPAVGDAEVGGDWYDLWMIDEDRVGVVVGDVVGRGVAAAAAMGQLRSALRATVGVTATTGDALAHLDDLTEQIVGSPSATVLLGILELASSRLTLSSAGHLPPILVNADRVRAMYEVRGAPIGFISQRTHRGAYSIRLEPEDTVILYSDGLVERRGETIDQGIERLLLGIRKNSGVPIEMLADSLLERCLEGAENRDDVALVCIRPVTDTPRHYTRVSPVAEIEMLTEDLHSWMVSHGDPSAAVDLVMSRISTAGAVVSAEAAEDDPPGSLMVEVGRFGERLDVTFVYRRFTFDRDPSISERRILRGWPTASMTSAGPRLEFQVPL